MALTGKKAELARLIIDLGAIEFGAFKMKAHRQPGNEHLPRSPIYLDLRTKDHPKKPGKLTAEAMELIGDLFRELLDDNIMRVFDCITDIPEAGNPFGQQAVRVAGTLGLGTTRVKLKKDEFPDGTTRISLNAAEQVGSGETCLLVDDLVTGADTKLEAIAALEGAGYEVYDILAVVDRLQGGKQKLKAAGYDVYTIFRLDELLEFYVETGLLGEQKAEQVMKYIRANQL